jgi:hypothetical protein
MKLYEIRTKEDFFGIREFMGRLWGVTSGFSFLVSGTKTPNGSWVVGDDNGPLFSAAVPTATGTVTCLQVSALGTSLTHCSTANKFICEYTQSGMDEPKNKTASNVCGKF